VYNIIQGTKAGVTLHEIANSADTGDIWNQKEVEVKITDTAKSLYERLQLEIVNLFIENWANIVNITI
jgi:methionyl-tRNA formyltransferase